MVGRMGASFAANGLRCKGGCGYERSFMTVNSQTNEITRKRLLWRAMHRGIKEMDIIVGGFAHARLSVMSAGELALFEMMLEIPDQELLSWVTGQEQVPEEWNTPLVLEMINFRPSLS